jgi:signal transduction histidine kinase
MQNVSSVAAVIAAGLLAAQALLVLNRARSCVRRQVPVLLAVFFALVSLHAFAAPGSPASELVLVGLLWSGGAFLLSASRRRGSRAWTGAAVAVVLTFLVGRALGHEGSAQYQWLRAFSCAMLGSIVLALVLASWREKRSAAAALTFLGGCLWMGAAAAAFFAGVAGLIPPRLQGMPELIISLCSGWLIFEEGFPLRQSWRGSLPALCVHHGVEESVYARLFDAENALAAQERVMAAGFLALGAAHELKSTLSMVKLAAHHGLVKAEPGTKDLCLRQIVEHTKTARDSAIDVLDRLSADGGEQPRALNAARDLTGPIRRAAAALRAQGVVIDLDLGGAEEFTARRFDVEQILLNLIRNAAEVYRRRLSEDSQPISIKSRMDDDNVVLEVRDWAGGVEEEVRPQLFKPSASGTGSTGLGLYLSRSLALSNGGRLDYLPAEGGSVFRLCLPAVEAE